MSFSLYRLRPLTFLRDKVVISWRCVPLEPAPGGASPNRLVPVLLPEPARAGASSEKWKESEELEESQEWEDSKDREKLAEC